MFFFVLVHAVLLLVGSSGFATKSWKIAGIQMDVGCLQYHYCISCEEIPDHLKNLRLGDHTKTSNGLELPN